MVVGLRRAPHGGFLAATPKCVRLVSSPLEFEVWILIIGFCSPPSLIQKDESPPVLLSLAKIIPMPSGQKATGVR